MKLRNYSAALAAVFPVFVILLWWILSECGIVKQLYLPSPSSVFMAAKNTSSTLALHAISSTIRLLVGYISGIVIGFSLAMLMKYYPVIETLLYSYIESCRSVPPIALIPFFILWFGFSDIGKIILVALGVSLIMVVSVYEAINNIKPIYIKAAYSLGATKYTVFKTIIIPAILPDLKSGLRISIAIGFSLEIVSEFMGADYGLGYLINVSKITFSTQTILLCVLIIGFIAIMLDKVIQYIMYMATKWHPKIGEAIQLNKRNWRSDENNR